jgi:hypothetical protein
LDTREVFFGIVYYWYEIYSLSDKWAVEDSMSMLRVAGQVIHFKLQLIGARMI